jgi:hypothetical protein
MNRVQRIRYVARADPLRWGAWTGFDAFDSEYAITIRRKFLRRVDQSAVSTLL